MTSWLVVLGVGLGSYAFRLLPLTIGERAAESERLQRMIHHAGTAALTALVVTALLQVASSSGDGVGGVGGLLVVAAAAAASTVAAIRGRSMLAVVGVGLGCFLVADLAHRALVA